MDFFNKVFNESKYILCKIVLKYFHCCREKNNCNIFKSSSSEETPKFTEFLPSTEFYEEMSSNGQTIKNNINNTNDNDSSYSSSNTEDYNETGDDRKRRIYKNRAR